MELKNFSEARETRAKAILEKGCPQFIDNHTYLVPSQFNSDKKYIVTFFDSFSCNCPDFQERCQGMGLFCKHIKAILIFKKMKTTLEKQDLTIEMQEKEKCPFCQSENLIKSGIRLTKVGNKQRYECKNCYKRFVLSPIPKIKGNAKLVCLSMDCYFKGLSFRDISDQFNQFYGLKISHETIRRWILKFTKVMNEYSKILTPETSGVWNADETMILTKRGINKKNKSAEFDYLWNTMDKDTKFLLASVNSGRSRNKKDAQKLFTEALKQNKKFPNQIITDKLRAYEDGVRKTFRNWGKERKVKHTSILGKRKIVNNNAIENLHNHQKEFLKVKRGIDNVQGYADGFRVFHNFVRKGIKDRKTPAERCNIGVNENNRWLGLLEESLKNRKG